MELSRFARDIEDTAELHVRYAEPLSAHTSLRLGGPAAIWIEPESRTAAAGLLQRLGTRDLSWMVLGAGTNVLFPDAGYNGVIVSLRRLCTIKHRDSEIIAEAGAVWARVVRTAIDLGLAGIEQLLDIPGTVGGAVAGNAGAGDQAAFDRMAQVMLADAGGQPAWIDAEVLNPSYRSVELTPGSMILAARWALIHADRAALQERAEAQSRRRKTTQPIGLPTAGCVFKNPSDDSAGRLIDSAGLKGARVGGAVVSTVHANFIVLDRPATACDVTALIELIRSEVQRIFGITLELELAVPGGDAA